MVLPRAVRDERAFDVCILCHDQARGIAINRSQLRCGLLAILLQIKFP